MKIIPYKIKAIYMEITPKETLDMMTDENIILDVRTKEEYDDGHIATAKLLPLNDILSGNLEIIADKNQKIIVYCRSGSRSRQAADALLEAGYTQIYDLGGIINWPYETYK